VVQRRWNAQRIALGEAHRLRANMLTMLSTIKDPRV
jgi:hypothetical protein